MNEFNQEPGTQQVPPAFDQPQQGYNQVNTDRKVSQLGRPMLGFMEAVKICLIEKYCCFTGRARRSEYWWFCLFIQIVGWIIGGVCFAIYFKSHTFEDYINNPLSLILSPAYIGGMVVSLAFFLPSLGAMVRRLHDTGRSGKWLLILLACIIPLVGSIVVLVFAIVLIVWNVQDSDRGENQYGPSPKYQ